MILVGNRRGGSSELAAHLLNVKDNEHVELHEIRGFVANDLESALHEAYGISRGTRCKKFLYSLSLSPPQEANVPFEVFETAIERIEQKLGFGGQPRAIVFHEKHGRRHAHVVWSRIKSDTMTAIDPYKDKQALQSIARELFIEQQWELPAGFNHKEDTDPLNYSHAEHSQAKRAKRDPKDIKRIFQRCWEQSDTKATFAHALSEHGFVLAKGDRRGFVAVDHQGEIYSVARYAGVKAKDLRARFGNLDELPLVEVAIQQFASGQHNIDGYKDTDINHTKQVHPDAFKVEMELADLEQTLIHMVERQRDARVLLHQTQQKRHIAEVRTRAGSLPTGLKAVWLKLSGQYKNLITELQIQAEQCETRDRLERQNLIESQLGERRNLQKQILSTEEKLKQLESNQSQTLVVDPEQALVIPPDPDTLSIKEKVNQNAEYILEVLTDKQESFTRNDILRSLAQYIDDPLKLGSALETVLRSTELVEIEADNALDQPDRCDLAHKYRERDKSNINAQFQKHGSRHAKAHQRYSTHSFQKLKHELEDMVLELSNSPSTFVSKSNINSAIKQQNKVLRTQINTTLSQQQEAAITHGLNDKQLTAIVGLAGTGKSTILSAVKTALERQGYHVHGAALSGKAADGLEQASHIKSRTTASWMRSWDQGNGLLTSNDVLVIDEAGMIGTRQLLRFVKEAKRSGAKLLLVGDPEQLQPINAGTPFKDICQTINLAKLTEIHRQKEDWQKQASLDLAEQRIDEALKAYEVRDKVIKTKDTSEAILRLVKDYMVDLELNGNITSRIALAHRRKDVHAINQAVRQARKTAGDLPDAGETLIQTDHGKRAFAKGDRIVFTKNDKALGVRNGMLGTVKSIAEATETNGAIELIVHIDGEPNKTIIINPSNYTAIDHGYATTIHKSQGVTVERAFVLGSPTMDRHLTYVAMTRHRHDAILYGDFSTLQNIRKVKNPQSKFTFNEQRRPTMH